MGREQIEHGGYGWFRCTHINCEYVMAVPVSTLPFGDRLPDDILSALVEHRMNEVAKEHPNHIIGTELRRDT
jgi:hypothetical protein